MAAMQSFLNAKDNALPDVMRQTLYSHDENARGLASGLIQSVAALRSIKRAAIDNLGKDAGEKISWPSWAHPHEPGPTTRPTVKIEGNKATVRDGGFCWPFIKIGGQWKLQIGEATLFHDYSPLLIERWRQGAAGWRAIARDVRAGRYKNAAEIEAAMKAAQLKAIFESNQKYPHPTTQTLPNRKR
jgi:hypothetical protein